MVLESTTRLKDSKPKDTLLDVFTKPQEKSLVFRDRHMAKGFAAVPRAILRDSKLSPSEKALYALLIDYAWQDGECFPGQNTLAHDMGLQRRQIINLLASLKKAKLISIKRPGLGKPNVYYIESLSKRYGKPMVDRP